MTKSEKISAMLKYWQELYKENPNVQANVAAFYRELTYIGIKKEDYPTNLSYDPSSLKQDLNINPTAISKISNPHSTFNNWAQFYANRDTECYISDKWNEYCHFVSSNEDAKFANEHIKVYIPLDSKHIEFGVKLIIDYLEKNQISHVSKVNKKITSNDVIVELVNPEDVTNLINFINSSSYLKEGLMEPNPFAFQKDNIAMTVDGNLSYNEVLSTLLKYYMDTKRKNDALDSISTKDFFAFITHLYTNQFIYYTDLTLQRLFEWHNNESLALNYKDVIALIIRSNQESFNFNDFIIHYKTCAQANLLNNRQIYEINKLLIEAVKTTESQNPGRGISYVENYYITGGLDLIPNDNDLHNRLVKYHFREIMQKLLTDANLPFYKYANCILELFNINLNEQPIKKQK